MGGGRRFPYPKYVWSPAGGWWANPAHWKRNTAIFAVLSYSFVYCVYLYVEPLQVSHLFYPYLYLLDIY